MHCLIGCSHLKGARASFIQSKVDDFLAGADMSSNLRLWAGALRMVRIMERPIEVPRLKVQSKLLLDALFR